MKLVSSHRSTVEPGSREYPAPAVPNSRRPTQRRPRHRRAILQCAQCGADPHADTGRTDGGLMVHMSQKHRGQTLTPESVAQLRQLDRAACVICSTIQSRPGNHCNHCRANAATLETVVGNIFQDWRPQPQVSPLSPSLSTPHTNTPPPPGCLLCCLLFVLAVDHGC